MWFGDLVTMTWWNGIWLNEAFATFMEMLAVDAWKPQWQRWIAFGVSRGAAFAGGRPALARGPSSSRSRAPREADAMFDVLTYEKGASVLRMLEQYLGPDVFRAGVRQYLTTHRFGNADTGDLWAALGQASGQPIPAVMDGWIFAPGYPLVSASVERGELVLRQQRFTYLREPLPWWGAAAAAADARSRWQVPVQLRISAGRPRHGRARAAVRARGAPAAAGRLRQRGRQRGRPRLLPRALRRRAARAALVRAACRRWRAIERYNLVNDAWAVTLAGLMPLTDYLDLTARFRDERDKNVWTILIGSLAMLNRLASAGRPARPGGAGARPRRRRR